MFAVTTLALLRRREICGASLLRCISTGGLWRISEPERAFLAANNGLTPFRPGRALSADRSGT